MELLSSRSDGSSVQVALRIRPQGNREKLEGAQICTYVIPNEQQVTIGGDRSFTYDNVFDTGTQQPEVYENCIHKLVEGTFDGFNATVLAYGQTGSGKTHTMGTAFDTGNLNGEHVGVIPRAISHVFRRIAELRTEASDSGIVPPTFDVSVQFIELYNEEIIDLLTDDRSASSNIRIHEDPQKGEIYLQGCTARLVSDAHQTLEILKNGALNRTVASTNMNEQSSRSHAIFTMQIKQQRVGGALETSASGETELEILTAKFHFVDLAGSERLKRTGATGDRAKEGISINCGLLALGNVISALGGASGRVSHVPYRDSKLTRLLQDSLGGNSRTLMIACVSPSDSDFVETLNTMKYANRAKNIKNKVVANQDKSSKMIGELRSKIAQLETEILEYRQGRRTVDADGMEVVSDQYHETIMLTAEVNQLRFRVKALQETNEILRGRNVDLQAKSDCASLVNNYKGMKEGGEDSVDSEDSFSTMVRGYVDEGERMRSQLYESQSTCEQLRREVTRWKNQALNGGSGMSTSFATGSFSNHQLIEEARAEVEKMKKSVISGGESREKESGETSDYASPIENTEEDVSLSDGDDEDDIDDEDLPFEEGKECVALKEGLADLQTEINIKERLIAELERSERRLSEVRVTYEKKLSELSLRIKATEMERDKMLADMSTKAGGDKIGEEKAKKIREDYERKLTDMRHEFKKLQMIEREHKRMQARQEIERQQMMRYQGELKDLKKTKVDLIKKIKEEIKKAQQDTMKNAKRISALDKEARKKDNQIRLLESKDRQREAFMKRTAEEMSKLRKVQRDTQKLASAQTRGANRRLDPRTPIGRNGNGNMRSAGQQQAAFSPKHAKIKWNIIEKKLSRLVTQKQTVYKMEEELERRISERHQLLDQISSLEKSFLSVREVTEREAISELLDASQQKLRYVQDLIQEAQSSIVQMEGNKEEAENEMENGDVDTIIETCGNLVEAKYIMQHLFTYSLEQSTAAARARAEHKESEARIAQLEQESFINEQLLESVIVDQRIVDDISNVLDGVSLRKKSRSPSLSSLNRASSPSMNGTTSEMSDSLHEYKARRRTATADELLYPMEKAEKETEIGESMLTRDEHEKKDKRRILIPAPSRASLTHPPTSSFSRNTRLRNTIGSLPNGSSLRNPPSNLSNRPNIRVNGVPERRFSGLSSIASVSRLTTVSEVTASTSSRDSMTSSNGESIVIRERPERQRSVFARLIPTWSAENSPNNLLNRKQGRIIPVPPTSSSLSSSRILSRTHSLEGHTKGVLCVDASNTSLITGAKDRLAKLWDLERGEEICTLGIHPNNVHSVKFIPNSHLAISVSMYQIRVWDLRTNECVKLLQSSGQVSDGDGGPVGSRQNTVPFLETVVNAAEVDPTGRLLFTSFCGDVRVWNIDKMASFGRMVGAAHSPRSEVSCLAASQATDGTGCNVFTGSRDHYIKMYTVSDGGEGVHEAKVEFNPPHYDNVTCIVPHGNHIYTASKDMNIMKINLIDYKRDHLELKAHNSYVQGMCLVDLGGRSLLSSVCKEGTVKLWDVSTTRRIKLVEELPKAHCDAINAVTSLGDIMFTASSDQTVSFWKATDNS